MKKNMGIADKLIRLVFAAVVVFLYVTHVINDILGIILLVLAGIFILKSLVSICPLYLPFNIHTNKQTN